MSLKKRFFQCALYVVGFVAFILFTRTDASKEFFDRFLDFRWEVRQLPREKLALYVVLIALAGVVLVAVIKAAVEKLKRTRYLRSPLSKIDKMDGEQFEKYLKAFFEERGYRVELTKQTGDYGADLLMKRDGKTVVVQAKRYTGHVGIKAIQEIIAAKSFYAADEGLVATNNYFTKPAKELAEKAGIELWDRSSLFNLDKEKI